MFKRLKNLFNKKKESIDKSINRIEIIPKKLYAEVCVHEIPVQGNKDGIKTLAYLTKGLINVGQKELLLLLKNDSEQYLNGPEEPILLFKTIFHNAESSEGVDIDIYTGMKEPGILGWTGIIYAEPPTYLNSLLPSPTLCMILLTEPELKAAMDYGATRFLAMLAWSFKHYPYPHWSDSSREILPVEKMREITMLNKAWRLRMEKYCFVRQEHNQIILKVSKKFDVEIPYESIDKKQVITILSAFDQSVGRHLTFSMNPDKTGIIEYEGANTRIIGGCFLMIVPEQEFPFGRIVEDGYGIFITNENWFEFWNAFKNKTSYFVKSNEKFLDFALEWF